MKISQDSEYGFKIACNTYVLGINQDIKKQSKSDVSIHEVGSATVEEIAQKVKAPKREEPYIINEFGEYELGGVMIHYNPKTGFLRIDDGYLRILFLGFQKDGLEVAAFDDLGDVDALIVPIGESRRMESTKVIEKVISEVDPTYLIPYGFVGDELEKFMRECGYATYETEKSLKLSNTRDPDQKNIQIVILKK